MMILTNFEIQTLLAEYSCGIYNTMSGGLGKHASKGKVLADLNRMIELAEAIKVSES